jgi:hypothetical protein
MKKFILIVCLIVSIVSCKKSLENNNLNNRNKSYGIVEVVASITKLFGFKPCAPCDKRRKYLNQITPNWLEKIITKIYEHGKTKNKK